jgi:hemerythrin
MALHYPDQLIFGIAEIDQQHRDLYKMYNEFSDALEGGRGEVGVRQLFIQLEDVTLYHFRFEQRLIEKSNYPDAEAHLQEHIQTIETFSRFKSLINSDKLSKVLLMSIKRYLIRVLINHVKNSDLSLCNHLAKQKVELGDPISIGLANKQGKLIGEILVDLGVISNYTLVLALEKQKISGHKLGKVLIDMGAAKGEDIVEACAIQIGLLRFVGSGI